MRFSPIAFDEQQELLCKPTTKSRFLGKVSPEPNSGCWLWLGAVGVHGHGQFFLRGKERKGLVMAHRAAWTIFRGQHPRSLLVCHKCDNPFCVNPDHMFLGTHKDNSADCVAKGRWGGPEDSRGEMNPAAILTDDIVMFIRLSGRSLEWLANKYGVSRTAIWQARTGDTWPHLPFAHSSKPKPTYSADQLAILADETVPPSVAAGLVGCSLQAVYTRRSKARRSVDKFQEAA